MKIIKLLCRIIAGSVFIFSGTVKAIDPLGSAYKFHDYFQAFHLNFLQDLSLPLAILLCTAEFITGFEVLTGFRLKAGIWGISVFIILFTPLTLYLALSNPVSDCGCFGDAIHLTNWQTFWKNVILLIMIMVLFIGRNKTGSNLKPATEWIIITTVAILFVLFSIINLIYLPVIDFLPYSTGSNIKEKMVIPEGMPSDQYSTTFIYEKEGIRKEFTLNNYPANDTSWKFVDQKSILIKKGYQPPIHDFSVMTRNGVNITDSILNYKGYSLLMVSTKLENANASNLSAGFKTGKEFILDGLKFYILTSSGSDELQKFYSDMNICITDETTLKSMVRSNPGYILLKNGTIEGKWSWANLPEKTSLIRGISGKQP